MLLGYAFEPLDAPVAQSDESGRLAPPQETENASGPSVLGPALDSKASDAMIVAALAEDYYMDATTALMRHDRKLGPATKGPGRRPPWLPIHVQEGHFDFFRNGTDPKNGTCTKMFSPACLRSLTRVSWYGGISRLAAKEDSEWLSGMSGGATPSDQS